MNLNPTNMTLTQQINNLRQGILSTRRGNLHTPFFMPVATKACIKGLLPHDMEHLDAQLLLMNTYHLFLRPGYTLVDQLGGLHSFSTWEKPILTDSGGYQVFSLAHKRKISEQGVEFQSHLDGSKHMLSPEESIRTQYYLGSDLIMVLDECPAGDSDYHYVKNSLELTTRWAERSRRELDRLCEQDHLPFDKRPLLFGIVQGGTYLDLRQESLRQLQEIGFDGYAIGGVSVGESRPEVLRIIKEIAPLLPEDKPRYLMGLGKPEEIAYATAHGVDMFDCVIPTREARHGNIYTWTSAHKERDVHAFLDQVYETSQIPETSFVKAEKIQSLSNRDNLQSLDPYADWPEAQRYSRAYIRHLFQTKEQAGLSYLTKYNLSFYLEMMKYIRSYSQPKNK